MAAVMLLFTGGFSIKAEAKPGTAQQDRTAPIYDLVHSSDPDRPGAGVTATEQVVVPGGETGSSSSGSGGSSGGGSAGAAPSAPVGRAQQCNSYDSEPRFNSILRSLAPLVDDPAEEPTPVGAGDLTVGRTYGRECRYADDGSLASIDTFMHTAAPPDAAEPAGAPAPVALPPSVEVIAREVYAEVPLASPEPHTSPPAGSPQLVGLPTWLWLDGSSWATFDASASVAGVTVTVVATPVSARWDMGDGTTVTCTGPGTAWTGDTSARTDCSHTYRYVSDDQPGGRYQASVTLTWSVTWSASTGESGTLPAASRTSGFDLDVRQRQAVITHDD
jgi:hypothetical protein